MLTLESLRPLPPTPAKVLLTLILLTNPDHPIIEITVGQLAHHANLCPRTCKTALQTLIAKKLLFRLPRRRRQPNVYLLVDPADAQATDQPQTDQPQEVHQTAPLTNAPAPMGQPAAPLDNAPPLMGQPAAPLSNAFSMGQPAALFDPALISQIFAALLPTGQPSALQS